MPVRSSSQPKPSCSVCAVCGPEPFLKRQAIADLANRILGHADRALALTEYDGSSAVLADVLDDLRTLPFLTERRLVVVRNADDFITRYRAELEEYAAQPSATGSLLLECKSLPANTRLYKRVMAVGEVVKCEEMKVWQVRQWLPERCREIHGKQLDPRAAALLLDQIGPELGLLDNELEKLAVYTGERKVISHADVEALSGRSREEEIWDLLSSISSGNQARAITLWEQVWQTDKAAPHRAIGGLAYGVRRLLNAKRAQEAGASMEDLRKAMMIWKDDQRLRAELAAFTTEQIELMLCRLLEADVAAKSGGASVQSSIEALIVEMCGRRGSRRATG
ncbi:MAG TPA: DNA polymerase III subunit delta [Phycisphaerae bacterium]|nr:DNA polymerase III subunit delta [Phycisphaerae bacterium]HRY69234.1 DNA polymerase III subunit delta [Phycisphaerae bacterium]HSA26196.1 DNA polymerase III subunit delta [Phycisphaerae bacterium]